MVKDTPPVAIEDGTWYKIAFGKKPWYEECCDCGLVHKVEYKVEDGLFWHKFSVDKRRTAKARKVRVLKQAL